MQSLHPGFDAVKNHIAKKSHVSEEVAGKILGKSTRNASESAKRKNPRLRRVLSKHHKNDDGE
jgi:hypothetical protein